MRGLTSIPAHWDHRHTSNARLTKRSSTARHHISPVLRAERYLEGEATNTWRALQSIRMPGKEKASSREPVRRALSMKQSCVRPERQPPWWRTPNKRNKREQQKREQGTHSTPETQSGTTAPKNHSECSRSSPVPPQNSTEAWPHRSGHSSSSTTLRVLEPGTTTDQHSGCMGTQQLRSTTAQHRSSCCRTTNGFDQRHAAGGRRHSAAAHTHSQQGPNTGTSYPARSLPDSPSRARPTSCCTRVGGSCSAIHLLELVLSQTPSRARR